MKHIAYIFLITILIGSCSDKDEKSDAYGNFEADEVIISSKMAGEIKSLQLEEGDHLKKGQQVGYVDSTLLSIKKQQIVAKREAVASKVQNILAEIKVLEEQKATLVTEKKRVERLLKDSAATQRQLDEIEGQVNVIDKRIQSVRTQNSTVLNELKVYEKQLAELDENIKNALIVSPIDGIVLSKYAEAHEIAAPGKALFKIADLDKMFLRVYIDGSQLPDVKIGQNVQVLIDKNKTKNQELQGTVSWISSQAEFTPKIIQTKKERVDLVYAVKVLVENDGKLKVGMPGEVNFQTDK